MPTDLDKLYWQLQHEKHKEKRNASRRKYYQDHKEAENQKRAERKRLTLIEQFRKLRVEKI